MNCLGCNDRDKGHNLVPEPPESMYGFILFIILSFIIVNLDKSYYSSILNFL